MAIPLLICDDSNMARKQVARSLPANLDVTISFATNGVEAIDAIKAGKGDILLLDLNMPVLDGYGVLEAIAKEDLPTMVVVISGDVQPEAYQRVKALGALDFIKKPVNPRVLMDVLTKYGLLDTEEPELEPAIAETVARAAAQKDKVADGVVALPKSSAAEQVVNLKPAKSSPGFELPAEMRDCYQEVANVAMGRAGDLLARLLNVFVLMPIPNVNLLEVSELSMALRSVESGDSTSGICQGFIGGGIAGEALLILNDSSFKDVAKLMHYPDSLDQTSELEMLMDMGNVLIGACLTGLSEQLDVTFSQAHPVVLGQHCNVTELISHNRERWQRTLAIEISYGIENYPIKCDLLLLFTEDSITTLSNKTAYMLDA